MAFIILLQLGLSNFKLFMWELEREDFVFCV